MLYVVSTPIGNLEDITIRALKILRKVELILAEDTRRGRVLLNYYSIHKPLLSFYDYNKKSRTKHALSILKDNRDIALISEAGTPGISDPGFFLIRSCIQEGVFVTACPGACAVINALIISGLATDTFLFVGFLPRYALRRSKALQSFARFKTTLIFFESRYRVIKTLSAMQECYGNKPGALLREMTKIHEDVLRGDLADINRQIQNYPLRGEFVIIVDNR